MPGLYSHSVFADISEPAVVTPLQPGLRTKIAEFSREAAQLNREERPGRKERERTEIMITTAFQDGMQHGKSVGWTRGFFQGMAACLVLMLVVAVLLALLIR